MRVVCPRKPHDRSISILQQSKKLQLQNEPCIKKNDSEPYPTSVHMASVQKLKADPGIILCFLKATIMEKVLCEDDSEPRPIDIKLASV